jgi:hypothetical protein
MGSVLEIIKYVLPSVVVLLTAYFLIKAFLQNEEKKYQIRHESEQKQKLLEIQLNSKKTITPIKLQAYERLVLFLERVSPHSLIIRVNSPYFTAKQMQAKLVQTIREEYEHNLSQQLYVSKGAWELIKKAKDETIKLINSAGLSMGENSKANELNTKIFEKVAELTQLPTEKALDYLKKEIVEFF